MWMVTRESGGGFSRCLVYPMFSDAVVMNLLPSQMVLYCSGSGNSPCGKELEVNLAGEAKRKRFSFMRQPDTHKLSVVFGYQDVHLRAFGADDLAADGVFAQVHLAAVRLVDGDGGHLPHHLRGEVQKTVLEPGNEKLCKCGPTARTTIQYSMTT